ncbi:MAG: YggS family pyridoxal phosphate-dependent enzyme [Chloroflexota bacterium]|nr:YggS family pyridoxal phosphate-dependent enzyme [Dehalococcoidia bacterium]MDW8047687.1 YggS family pyridoxal phosphate-dependent enzyme [Chloroflexota bacterium]
MTANLVRVQQRIATACARAARAPAEVTLIAVTKGRPLADVAALWRAGITDAGENRVQEGEAKRRAAEAAGVQGLRWHLIGHLQRNKAARALAAFDVFHGIDNAAVLEAVARRAVRPVEVFLEVNVAREPTKHGCAPEELPELVATARALPGIQLVGLMTVAPAVDDPEAVRPVFRQLRLLAQAYGLPKLSMGMSNDFEVAIEEGATHVRIGRALFEGAPR